MKLWWEFSVQTDEIVWTNDERQDSAQWSCLIGLAGYKMKEKQNTFLKDVPFETSSKL